VANNTRVFNITRGHWMKLKQAERAIDNCSHAWVEKGLTVRDLTLNECIHARSERDKERTILKILRNGNLADGSSVHGLQGGLCNGK
jgi:hypothetical protein